MRRVLRVGKDVKGRRARVKELMGLNLSDLEVDIKLQLIRELIPLGLMHVGEVLKEEVRVLAGDRYKRNGIPDHVRWCRQWGSVYIGEQKLPILYQRVRDKKRGKEVELKSYKGLQEPRGVDEALLRKVLLGLSCRRYRECAEMVPEAFGLGFSTVSEAIYKGEYREAQGVYAKEIG